MSFSNTLFIDWDGTVVNYWNQERYYAASAGR